ncbi:unnamed protein product [Lampetra planeri]
MGWKTSRLRRRHMRLFKDRLGVPRRHYGARWASGAVGAFGGGGRAGNPRVREDPVSEDGWENPRARGVTHGLEVSPTGSSGTVKHVCAGSVGVSLDDLANNDRGENHLMRVNRAALLRWGVRTSAPGPSRDVSASHREPLVELHGKVGGVSRAAPRFKGLPPPPRAARHPAGKLLTARA